MSLVVSYKWNKLYLKLLILFYAVPNVAAFRLRKSSFQTVYITARDKYVPSRVHDSRIDIEWTSILWLLVKQ